MSALGLGTALPVRDRPAHPSNYGARHGAEVDLVVLHTEEGTEAGTAAWFGNAAAHVSSHYGVDTDGTRDRFVAEEYAAWHAGNADVNRRSIGIEHAGHTDDGTPPSEAMLRSSAELCADILDRYHLPTDRRHVIGHAEVPGATHRDPGAEWPWDRYMALVATFRRAP